MTLAKAALKGTDYYQLAQVARFIPEWTGTRNCMKHFLGIKVDNHDYPKKSITEVLMYIMVIIRSNARLLYGIAFLDF
jgi:hypothetical protein